MKLRVKKRIEVMLSDIVVCRIDGLTFEMNGMCILVYGLMSLIST